MKLVQIKKNENPQPLVARARWCSSWLCRLVGLQFHRPLATDEALVMVWERESVAKTSIHMFFVFFPITAIWVNAAGRVTSAQLARPWRPFYASPEPACYVVEAHADLLAQVQVGDRLEFV